NEMTNIGRWSNASPHLFYYNLICFPPFIIQVSLATHLLDLLLIFEIISTPVQCQSLDAEGALLFCNLSNIIMQSFKLNIPTINYLVFFSSATKLLLELEALSLTIHTAIHTPSGQSRTKNLVAGHSTRAAILALSGGMTALLDATITGIK
ncbi:hypothetical protein ACJX0J_016915, partial [Zea mays]